MLERSLLEKEGPITLDDLKANFRANDFSAYSLGFGEEDESVERTKCFEKIRAYFEAAWSEQLKALTGKSMQNFTEHSAAGSLEKPEGNLIAGTLVDVLENKQQTEMLLDLGLQVLREPLEMELEQLATAQGKTPEELSEEEFAAVLSRLSDQFLGKMMNLLLQTQDIEQWMEFTRDMPAHEDFNEKMLLKLDQYIEDHQFLCDCHIDTAEELFAFRASATTQFTELEKQREQIRNHIRHAPEAEKAQLKEQAKALTSQITPLRKQIKIADRIMDRSVQMRQLLDQERQLETIEMTKERKFER